MLSQSVASIPVEKGKPDPCGARLLEEEAREVEPEATGDTVYTRSAMVASSWAGRLTR